ncbi:MAG: hypothetical protein HZC54_20180 [Verrucomicrobia bacterium]|nr:hypothetical protein [Verrucomicrobiota bacterium]
MNSSVLWLDDEWTKMPELVQSFEAQGMNVHCESNLEGGLQELKRGSYGIVLLDMILSTGRRPDVPTAPIDQKPFVGLDFVDSVAGMAKERRPAVVVMTIADDERLARKLRKWERQGIVYGVILKGSPLSFHEVASSLCGILQNRQNTSV